MMKIGKLSNEMLSKLILGKIRSTRNEILVRPGIGEDCGALDFEQEICVISSDPITGTDSEIGNIAVQVACNDIAASGAEPVGMMVTMLIPPNASYEMVEKVMKQLTDAAMHLHADIIGGHTEVTDAVNRVVLMITAVGKTIGRQIIKTSGAKPGDDIVLTKYAGLEGTAILAFDHQKELEEKFGSRFIHSAQKQIQKISAVKEGMIAAKHGVHAMHDVTEGGVLGAVWEMCNASGCGAEIEERAIPILEETSTICSYFDIHPLKLISSGCMLIATENGVHLTEKLMNEGVPAAVIGKMTEKKACILTTEAGEVMIPSPKSDELYSVKR